MASHEEDDSDVWDPMRQAHPPFQGLDMDWDSFTTPYTDTIAGHKFIRGLFLSLHPAVEMLRQLIVQLSCLAQLACCQAAVSSYHFRLTLPDL